MMKTKFLLLAILASTMAACSDNDENDQKEITTPPEETSHAIDMGMPSGTLWCSMNVGASTPTDFGDYYQMSYSKDVATEKLGAGYSTPTKEQFEELIAHTTQQHTEINNVKGMLFKASNENSIFLPAAAHLYKTMACPTRIWLGRPLYSDFAFKKKKHFKISYFREKSYICL